MATALANTPLSARVTEAEKSRFQEVCEAIGTSPSNAIRMFVSAFNRRGGFPFDPSNPYGFPTETLEAMDAAAHGRNLIGPFSTNKEMWESIFGADEE